QGYEVVGVTQRLWHAQDDRRRPGGCCSIDDIADARRVSHHLGIRHYVLDMEKEFCAHVVEDFVAEYLAGRTPNPCIVCNEKIKFDLLLKRSRAMGFGYMATGHYARIEKAEASGSHAFFLKKGVDERKDQSYVLYRLTKKALSRLLLPLGGYTKKEIRSIAAENGLPAAAKPESQEICFIDRDYATFLRQYLPDVEKKIMPGPIVGTDGRRLGRHRGLAFYTVGQRSGLGLTSPSPLYVTRIDTKANTLVVGNKEEVFSRTARAEELTWVAGEPPAFPCACEVKIRRLHQPARAVLDMRPGAVVVTFEEPQPAVTPGQAAVFYRGEYVLGGGIIA
ncbi:MAG: tRNA 2-thiouridine(34) synthase MnmA, partial [Endomicrobiales bacterium]